MVEWRFIGLEEHNAFMNMALDEACTESVSSGKSFPTIRFYRWSPSAVSIGCFQSMEDEVNIDVCKELGIDVVRRRTGGGAVYHDYEGEITYSVIAPETIFPKDIIESYKIICNWIINSLEIIGLKGEFKPINDIIVGGKKISGNAQTRRNGVLLQHGTILYDLDVKKMFSVLRVSSEKISDKLIQSVEERVTRVLDHTSLSKEDLYKSLLQGFGADKNFKMGSWQIDEIERATFLSKEKYAAKKWNFSR